MPLCGPALLPDGLSQAHGSDRPHAKCWLLGAAVPLARHLGGGPPAAIRKRVRDPPSAVGGSWVWAGKKAVEGIPREGPGARLPPLHLLTEVSGACSP